MDRKLLIIGHTFPEPSTTAAGVRMIQLIKLFTQQGYKILFASTARFSDKSALLDRFLVEVVSIELNNSSFDDFISQLAPQVVLFDRFVTEEQFGWRVVSKCPNALRILDTEDLHFLRKARDKAIKQGLPVTDADIYTETSKRELASILRSDLSLIISEVEMKILTETFKVSENILLYLPFMIENVSETVKRTLPSFKERMHFVTIGNFLHAPNLDAVRYVKNHIWPLLKKRLPKAEFHVYGAYATESVLQMHNVNDRFLIKGWVADVGSVMTHAKLCLAPIRFGAGLKGKFIDAMQFGTPIVTTPIGAEGLFGNMQIPGAVESVPEQIINKSEYLYTDQNHWQECQQYGFEILEKRFPVNYFNSIFVERLHYYIQHLQSIRNKNFIGQVLLHQSLQSTKYMSKWIEEKNKTKL